MSSARSGSPRRARSKRAGPKLRRGAAGTIRALRGVTEDLPALVIAYKYGQRAADVGFDWEDAAAVIAKLNEEIEELGQAAASGQKSAVEEEIGDVLFTVANLARFLGVHPELALRKTNRKFRRRFHDMEKSAKKGGKTLTGMSMDDLERLWLEAKKKDLRDE